MLFFLVIALLLLRFAPTAGAARWPTAVRNCFRLLHYPGADAPGLTEISPIGLHCHGTCYFVFLDGKHIPQFKKNQKFRSVLICGLPKFNVIKSIEDSNYFMIIYCPCMLGGTTLRLAAFISLVVLVSATAHGFQQECSVRVPLSVRATKGKEIIFLKRVTVENFHATLNKEPMKINVMPHHGPYRFILLLDHSGSMEKLWPVEVLFAHDFLQSLNSDSKVGLLIFNHKTELSVLLQSPAAVLQELLKFAHVAPSGRTALFEHIEQAIAWLAPPNDGDIIYVITDGGDNRNDPATLKLRQQLQGNGIRVFSLIVANQDPATLEERSGLQQLQDLSLGSGGDFVKFDASSLRDRQSIPNYATSLFPEMVYQFTLELRPPPSVYKGKLKLKYEDPKIPNIHFVVRYPETVFNTCSLASGN